MLCQAGQARDTSGECMVASLELIRPRVPHVKALGLPKRSRSAFMASQALMLVCARTARLRRVEKVPHGLPTTRRAGDFVAPVEAPRVRLSRSWSVGRSGPMPLVKHHLSSPLKLDSHLTGATPSRRAGSITLTACARERGTRGNHLRLFPETLSPIPRGRSSVRGYLTTSCAVSAHITLHSISARLSFGAVVLRVGPRGGGERC